MSEVTKKVSLGQTSPSIDQISVCLQPLMRHQPLPLHHAAAAALQQLPQHLLQRHSSSATHPLPIARTRPSQ